MKLFFNQQLCSFIAAMSAVLSIAGTGSVASFKTPVYGMDDRLDLFEVTDPVLLGLADSTVAFIDIERMDLDIATMTYSLKTRSLRDHRKVCGGEPFSEQPTLSSCSGSLVGPDLVLTAGHCVKNIDECQSNMRVAFGFSVTDQGKALDILPDSEVYNCQEIVARIENYGAVDFALIRLDRKVLNHKPLRLNRDSPLETGTGLVVIGHPDGLPTKISGGANVRDTTNPSTFTANLDTFKASSGSPVFNARTSLIEGIVTGGEEDYNFDFEQQCYRVRYCENNGCRGEKSVRASIIAPFVPVFKSESPQKN